MGFCAPSFADPPFGAPPDITIDLPPPPSVNRTRKIDWRAQAKLKNWMQGADALMLSGPKRIVGKRIDKFELLIVLSKYHTRIDLDNSLKFLIDYLRRIEVIVDDSPKHMRRITVEWGWAPQGSRVTVRPIA
jgi:Holliday junction resolvase RusA-like endonuclease